MATNYTAPAPDSVTLTLRPFTPKNPDDVTLYVDDFGPGVITGRVTDTNGNPVEGAYIKAVDQDALSAQRVQTDQYGEYHIYEPDGGTFHVTARLEEGGDVLSSVSLPSVTVGST